MKYGKEYYKSFTAAINSHTHEKLRVVTNISQTVMSADSTQVASLDRRQPLAIDLVQNDKLQAEEDYGSRHSVADCQNHTSKSYGKSSLQALKKKENVRNHSQAYGQFEMHQDLIER